MSAIRVNFLFLLIIHSSGVILPVRSFLTLLWAFQKSRSKNCFHSMYIVFHMAFEITLYLLQTVFHHLVTTNQVFTQYMELLLLMIRIFYIYQVCSMYICVHMHECVHACMHVYICMHACVCV